MLAHLGLSQVDEAVYRTMLEHPDFGVAELGAALTLDEPAIRSALDKLADLALVKQAASGLRAVRPQAGLMTLVAQAEAEIALRQSQIDATRAAIIRMASVYQAQDQHESAIRREGLEAVRERLAELAYSAKRECLSFSTGGAQPPDAIDAEKPLNHLALERGVVIRNIYQESFRNDPGTLAYAQWMADLGGRSRTVPILPMRMVIVDREVALVPLDPENSAAGALELHSAGVVAGLVALFDQFWDSGTPFGEEPPRDDNGLSPQERQLLRLLAAGHTDESAARKLALSLRSVQRMMTIITERLGTNSRFQAGAEAVRRGWI